MFPSKKKPRGASIHLKNSHVGARSVLWPGRRTPLLHCTQLGGTQGPSQMHTYVSYYFVRIGDSQYINDKDVRQTIAVWRWRDEMAAGCKPYRKCQKYLRHLESEDLQRTLQAPGSEPFSSYYKPDSGASIVESTWPVTWVDLYALLTKQYFSPLLTSFSGVTFSCTTISSTM